MYTQLIINILHNFCRDEELALRNKRTKKEDEYYKLDSRNVDPDWERYKKRNTYNYDKLLKHEKSNRDEMLKVSSITHYY